MVIHSQSHAVARKPGASVFDGQPLRVDVDAGHQQHRAAGGLAQHLRYFGRGHAGADAAFLAQVIRYAVLCKSLGDGTAALHNIGQPCKSSSA